MDEKEDDLEQMDKGFYKRLYSITPKIKTEPHTKTPVKDVVTDDQLPGSNWFRKSSKYEAGSNSLPTSYAVNYCRSDRNDLVYPKVLISDDGSDSDVSQDVQRMKMPKVKITKKITQDQKRMKNEDKPFSCYCGSRFKKRIYRDTHIKKYHSRPVSTREIFKERLFCKATKPAKVFEPERRTSDQVENHAQAPDEDVDEIHIKVNETVKKRIIFKLPDGKKLKMDIQLE